MLPSELSNEKPRALYVDDKLQVLLLLAFLHTCNHVGFEIPRSVMFSISETQQMRKLLS